MENPLNDKINPEQKPGLAAQLQEAESKVRGLKAAIAATEDKAELVELQDELDRAEDAVQVLEDQLASGERDTN